MQLSSGEQSILAYFNNDDEAFQALEELANNGYTEISLSRISSYAQPQSQNKYTLSSLVLGGHPNKEGGVAYHQGSLLAARPSVSGMSGSIDTLNYSHVLAVVSESSRIEQARRILAKYTAVF